MEAGQGPVKATPGYAWAPHSAIARPPLQDYNPITLTLADALQLLATKSRWSTARKDRKAALQSLEAAMDAGQPAAGRDVGAAAAAGAEAATAAAKGATARETAATAAAAADNGAAVRKKRGRKSKAELAAAAQAAAEPQPEQQQQQQQQEVQPPKRKPGRPRKHPEAGGALQEEGGEEQEAPRRQQPTAEEPPIDAGDERQLATLAALQARLALDAAADFEVGRLHVSWGCAGRTGCRFGGAEAQAQRLHAHARLGGP